jgi:hypothetical protein
MSLRWESRRFLYARTSLGALYLRGTTPARIGEDAIYGGATASILSAPVVGASGQFVARTAISDAGAGTETVSLTLSADVDASVSESLTYGEAVTTKASSSVGVSASSTLVESFTLGGDGGYTLFDAPLHVADSASAQFGLRVGVTDNLSTFEALQTGSFVVQAVGPGLVRASFQVELQLEGASDTTRYALASTSGGVPVRPRVAYPQLDAEASGTDGVVLRPVKAYGVLTLVSSTTAVDAAGSSLEAWGVVPGDRLHLDTGPNAGLYEVLSVSGSELTLSPSFPSFPGASTPYRVDASPSLETRLFGAPGYDFTGSVGDYLTLSGLGANAFLHARIEEILTPHAVRLDRPLSLVDPEQGSLPWSRSGGVSSVLLETDEMTRGASYRLTVQRLRTKDGRPFSTQGEFVAVGERPKVTAVTCSADDGTVTVTYDSPMRQDAFFADPAEYLITGPTNVTITAAYPTGPRSVALKTLGLGEGLYAVTANASGTPHDLAGNPVDPLGNVVSFASVTPRLHRSIFTDKGPIAKPPLTIASGSGVTLTTYVTPTFGPGMPFTSDELVFAGASFDPDAVGLYVTIAGTQRNDGRYRVAAFLSSNRLRLQGAFHLPDTSNGGGTWALVDPRHGHIADDPIDVTAFVDGVPVAVEAVFGLLGQVVLAEAPDPEAEVTLDYAWVPEPTVEFRRLNSHEFVLNQGAPGGAPTSPSGHAYRYQSVLLKPDDFVANDALAELPAPLERDLFYRAFERAYSGLLNDPNLLVLNTPSHRVAYPPLERTIAPVSIAYEALTLPEADATAPWERVGDGSAMVSGGELIATDTTTGPEPTGEPFYWTRPVDLSFDHVFAGLWRMRVDNVASLDGVYTGVGVGWSDGHRAVVVGSLLVGSVRKIGLLKRGEGRDPSRLLAWGGGLSGEVPTDAPADVDWSLPRSYRVLRGADGVVRVYLDGDAVETLRMTAEELPSLDELDAPFDVAQGIFFGSFSRVGRTTSVWDFVRYLVLPTNPVQSQPFVAVDYGPTTVPEEALIPWTPLGGAGTETLVGSALVLDATGASPPEDGSAVGGDFRGFSRVEPLLRVSSDVVLETRMRIRSWTHGLSPTATMFAIDDGSRLVQASLVALTPAPRVGYAGRALPNDVGWSVQGGAPYRMAGRALHVTDTSPSDGVVFFHEETAASNDDRVLYPTANVALEFRVKMVASTPDPQGFAGFAADLSDGWTSFGVGFFLRSGVARVAMQAEGAPIAGGEFNASWADGEYHTYRLVRSFDFGALTVGSGSGQSSGTFWSDPLTDFVTAGVVAGDRLYIPEGVAAGFHPIAAVLDANTLELGASIPSVVSTGYQVRQGGNAVVSLFVDAAFVGVLDLDAFPSGTQAAVMSFGTATPTSVASTSEVEIAYAHAWRVIHPRVPTFAGIWKGTEEGTLLDYHLPSKATGFANVSPGGQTLSDPTEGFVGITAGDHVLIDTGPNRGVYTIAGVSAGALTLLDPLPVRPTSVSYRVPAPHDWTVDHDYRLTKSPDGSVTLGVDGSEVLRVSYGSLDLPPSSVGLPSRAHAGMPSVSWGAFDPDELSQTSWSSFRYRIDAQPSGEGRIVPPHHVINERNVMSSPEHLTGSVTHDHTQFSASSTGVPAPWEPYVENPAVRAYTKLNEGTPLVPQTQTYEVRRPMPVFEHVAALNSPGVVLNDPAAFVVNDGETRVTLRVPEDVLYNDLQIEERSEGEADLLAPFVADYRLGTLFYQKEVCLAYTGNTLPELDPAAATPWTLASEVGASVSASVSSGILTYGVEGGQTLYRNDTPLTDPAGLETTVTFRLRVTADASNGTGDTGVRVGFSALGLTAALAFVTTPLGDREVRLLDLNVNEVLAAVPVDYLDGGYHTYQLVKNVAEGTLDVLVDP